MQLVLVRALNLARLANRKINLKLDISGRLSSVQKALSGRDVRRREANAVIATVCGAECEATVCGATLRCHAVVIVKDLVDGNVDAHVWVRNVAPRLLVPLCCRVVACIVN